MDVVKLWEKVKKTMKRKISEGEFELFFEHVKAEKIENSFVIVPCVGISKDFTRIGYGAGYYDRYFSDSMDNYFVGSTHNFAMNLDFKGESHDIIMNEVIWNFRIESKLGDIPIKSI